MTRPYEGFPREGTIKKLEESPEGRGGNLITVRSDSACDSVSSGADTQLSNR